MVNGKRGNDSMIRWVCRFRGEKQKCSGGTSFQHKFQFLFGESFLFVFDISFRIVLVLDTTAECEEKGWYVHHSTVRAHLILSMNLFYLLLH